MSDIKIAGNLTINGWRDLEIKLKSNHDLYWDKAFEYFETRINSRYLKPIDAILNTKSNDGEGFAVVNLQCSLIEMIESFINGCIHEYDVNSKKIKWKRKSKIIFHSNKSIFKSFFENRTPFNDSTPKINGNHFYDYVRCPILHETQTKKNWKIRKDIDKTGLSYFEEKKEKIIYRENFQRDLKLLIENYKKTIVNGGNFDGIPACVLRENFISKFNHICKQS